MTDNSSNFLSLEVVFQKKVSLQRHCSSECIPTSCHQLLVTPKQKITTLVQARALNGAKVFNEKKFNNQNFSKKWKNFIDLIYDLKGTLVK